MTIRTDAAPAVIQSVLTDAERHQLLARANYPHLQEEPGSYLVKITEDMVRTKLLAALPTGEAHAVPPHQWQTTVAQMKALAAELSLAAETMGGDDEESQDVALILAVAPAATVQDDDGDWNAKPILTVRLEEYPEEGVYPVDPHDPTGGRIDSPTPPASAQPESMREGYPHDDPQFIASCREHDILGTAMQGLAAVFWRAASAQDDAKDERRPLFWYRPRSDDGHEGPIHNDRIEEVRKQSGAWVPLYPGFATLPKPLYDLRYHGEFIRGWNQCLREVNAAVAAPAAGDARDAARYRWLTEDHADLVTREHRNGILRRMTVMSHSAASADIDAAIAAQQGEGGQ
ncbi:hypothetical protein [Achromobacter sp. UBA4530]|uniref:hypothetical protein n=1 Tax=Achromobacter sp. UBA4530 TaxID=1945912 RepID=UPI00257AB13A|nr:hypothetical protein [Achromobacter sp. UBA4530]